MGRGRPQLTTAPSDSAVSPQQSCITESKVRSGSILLKKSEG